MLYYLFFNNIESEIKEITVSGHDVHFVFSTKNVGIFPIRLSYRNPDKYACVLKDNDKKEVAHCQGEYYFGETVTHEIIWSLQKKEYDFSFKDLKSGSYTVFFWNTALGQSKSKIEKKFSIQ